MFQASNKKKQKKSVSVVLVSFLLTLNTFIAIFCTLPADNHLCKAKDRHTKTSSKLWIYLTHFSGVSVVNFEHVIVGWANLVI